MPEPGTAVASFRRDVVPLFNASCAFAGCHGPDSYVQPTLGPDLSGAGSPSYPTPDEVYQTLQTFGGPPRPPLLVPGQPEQSFLFRKLTGDFSGLACDVDAGLGCGAKMPRDHTMPDGQPAPQPTPAQITAVQAWIAEGAQDN